MMANDDITRRTFLKGAVAMATLASTTALLAACSSGSTGQKGSAADSRSADAESGQATAGSDSATGQAGDAGRVLVAYFSATGNTEGIAGIIADHLDADVFVIAPAQPYTSADLDYNDPDSRASQERENANRSVELEAITPDGFDAYDTVFVGYPIWWGDASWVVDGFVAGNDFTGKTVVPFCTSASSPMGASGDALALMAGTGTWIEGARFSGSASPNEVTAWVDGLGL